MQRRLEAMEAHREKKIISLKKGPKKSLRLQKREKEEEKEILEAIKRLFLEPESKKKTRRKRKPPSERKVKETKKKKRDKLRLKTMAKKEEA